MKKTFLLLIIVLSIFVFKTQAASVKLTLDMTSYTGPSFTRVMLNGGFKGWGDAVGLTTDNDSLIWTATVNMNAGVNDYRFEIGGGAIGWTAEWEGKTSTGSCFVNPDGNASNMRWITIAGDTILPNVAWEKCTVDAPEPVTGQITVNIDMSSYVGPSFTSVMMNGGFKGWGNAIALTTDQDSILWTTTVSMNAGVNDYRFEIGGGAIGWTAEWEGKTSTGSCFVNPDGNASNMRWITVNGNATLPTVSWESCVLNTSGTTDYFENSNDLYLVPNPLSDKFGIVNLKTAATISILNLSGQQILNQSIVGNEQIDIHSLSSGIYLVKIKADSEESVLKLVKK